MIHISELWHNMILYLKSKIYLLLLFVLIICTYLFVTCLSKQNTAPIVYSTELVIFFILLYFLGGFISFYKKKREIKRLINADCINLTGHKFSLYDEGYQVILDRISKYTAQVLTEKENEAQERIDYQNLWIHEIKTSIFALKLIIQTQTSGEVKMKLQEEVLHIEQYVETSLNYYRIQNIENDVNFAQYNLFSIIREAVKKYSIVFINKNIDLIVDNEEVTILTDRKWLLFIIEQVLSNSLKYTGNGGKISFTYNISVRKLEIRDTGIGIAKEDIGRLFNKSFTGYNGRINGESTGIGLYMCKKVATMMEMNIEIKSEVGCGTTVELYFNNNILNFPDNISE